MYINSLAVYRILYIGYISPNFSDNLYGGLTGQRHEIFWKKWKPHTTLTNENWTLGVVAEWSKVLTAVPCPLMVWSTLALGTYQFRFVSWMFHVIFSFVHFISLYTLGDLRAIRKPLPYNMYLFNLRIVYDSLTNKNYMTLWPIKTI